MEVSVGICDATEHIFQGLTSAALEKLRREEGREKKSEKNADVGA